MTRKLSLLVAASSLAILATLPALAQEVRGKREGDLVLGASLLGAFPMDGGSVQAIGGTPSASNTVTPQLDLSYFFTPNLALNVIAATTRHDVEVKGSALGDVDLGRVWLLPPTVTLQYHFMPTSRFSPYLGAGVNYTVAYGEGGSRTSPVADVDAKNAWGWALNAGIDVELSQRWVLNLDVKKLYLRPDVAVTTSAGGRINATTELDPWLVGLGVRYRF